MFETSLLVGEHVPVVVVTVVLGSRHFRALVDDFDQQALVLPVNPSGLFPLDRKRWWTIVEGLRL